jgi:DNA-binding transcriptional ArsR family regulator
MPTLPAILKALANPNRLRLYQVICRRGGGDGLTVEKLAAEARMKQPAVSAHVTRLAAAGLVVRRKSRRWVHCTPGDAARELLRRFAADPAGFTDGR